MNVIDQLKQNISVLESLFLAPSKIGIGVNTHNRPTMLAKCLEKIREFMPPNAELVIVDDASTYPVESTFRFETNVGIAKAKNKTIELLYTKGCDHFFLFDDDTWPLEDKWWEPYCNSKEPHLMYIFKGFKNGSSPDVCRVLHQDSDIVAYSKPRGCMLYYDRKCIDSLGGMHEDFEKWGWEHVDFSDRIFNAGLTKFPYMDVANRPKIYSDDEVNSNVNTTVSVAERNKLIEKNSAIYGSRFGNTYYERFMSPKNIFLTCLLTGSDDPQRQGDNKISISEISALASSITSLDGNLVVLHDALSIVDIENFTKDKKHSSVEFFKVEKCTSNPYFYRWVVYRDFLIKNSRVIKNVICVDATDVEILRQPSWDVVNKRLVVGDEISILNDESGWMRKNHTGAMSDHFLSTRGDLQMLNAGTLGSNTHLVVDFCSKLIQFWQSDGATHNTDMLIFNYVCRTFFECDLYHGRSVTTPFKNPEPNGKNKYSWIKHK